MLYKFSSAATGDLIMLGPDGDQMLRLLGREPAPQGILEPEALASAIGALQAAVAADAPGAQPQPQPLRPAVLPVGRDAAADDDQPSALRQRLWPVIEMMRRAQAAGASVLWGV
jgi:hypothetical protein